MTPEQILRHLFAAGVRLDLRGDRLCAWPATSLNDELRALIRSNKPALVIYLVEAHQTDADLIEAAMRACDFNGDGLHAREQMQRDCLETPPHLRADLRDYFNQSYRAKS
jgi:LmbE family N-acetylglucosaminyl deacetylase